MSNIDTIDKLSSKIDNQLAWRKKELIALNSFAEINPENKHIRRAAFPLICAHYEGFLKQASILYLQHVSDLKIPLVQLKNAFAPFVLNSEFVTCNGSKRASVRARVISEYIAIIDSPMIIPNPKTCIDTESNPKPDVLTEIFESLAIDSTPFKTKFTFINDSLLETRHAIVHGEFREISLKEFQEVLKTTLQIIEDIKSILLDSAIQAAYKK